MWTFDREALVFVFQGDVVRMDVECTASSVLAPLGSALHTFVETRRRLIGTANLHLSEIRHATFATFARAFGYSLVSLPVLKQRKKISSHSAKEISHTFRLVHVLPAVRTTQHVLCRLGLHVFALVVAAVKDHLVRTCATFEAVFACVNLI
jgi:hypothetical protein